MPDRALWSLVAKPPLTLAELSRRVREMSDRRLGRLLRDSRAGARALAEREKKRRELERCEEERLESLLLYERGLWQAGTLLVAGVDEVGVGPLAGPVVAGAVVLRAGTSIAGIDDSKRLSHKERLALACEIRKSAVAFSIGSCSVEEIDTLNIYHASREAMRRAVLALQTRPAHLLVDARRVPRVDIAQTSIVGGDRKSQSIAAASILAKIERDAMMDALALRYPGYGFERHKGYATLGHKQALSRLGPTPLHRRSFAPVAEQLGLYPEQLRFEDLD